jgi:lipopolysaccharide export system permease protein
MQNVSWYQRDPAGMVTAQIRSPRATYANPGWRLESPVRFDVKTTTTQRLGSLVIAKGVDPGQVAISSVDADSESLFALSRSIDELRAAGRRTSELDGKWWHKLSGPLSSVLMPLLGAVAAFGLARSGQLLIRAIIGMALGFTYFVIDNAALAMGNFGGYPPLIAAWAPFLLFALVGETVLIRTEE